MGHTRAALAGFLLGAAGMFAVMYSTQAILPELSRDFDVSAAEAGLTVSIVILVLAAGAWVWGPLSDRWGRKRTLVLASALVAPPTLASALSPSFEVLLACRALQGLCMPGLLTVGAPYVVEVFGPRLGGRAMGLYITALVSGGIVGRVGIALATTAFGWRWPVGAFRSDGSCERERCVFAIQTGTRSSPPAVKRSIFSCAAGRKTTPSAP